VEKVELPPGGAQTREGQARLKESGVVPIPRADNLTKPYWDAALRCEITIQRCSDCGRFRHPPSQTCERCGSSAYVWTPMTGKGTIYSFVIDYRNLIPSFDEPYVVALISPVEVDGDPVRIVANVLGCDVGRVHIGMPVRVVFETAAPGVALPQFVPDVEE
jgi:uncharacterized OB-fold protein